MWATEFWIMKKRAVGKWLTLTLYIVFFDFLVGWIFCYCVLMLISQFSFFLLIFFFFFFWCVSLLFSLHHVHISACMHWGKGGRALKLFPWPWVVLCSLFCHSVMPSSKTMTLLLLLLLLFFPIAVAYIELPVSVPSRNSAQVWLLSSRACSVLLRAGSQSFQPNWSQQ